ncbi:hypothetical protein ACWD0A_06655 [Streptomyces sp. NPDC002867]
MLSDDWTGRIVSTYTPHIPRDLARHFGGAGADGPALFPHGAEAARRLAAHPAVGPHLDLDGIARRTVHLDENAGPSSTHALVVGVAAYTHLDGEVPRRTTRAVSGAPTDTVVASSEVNLLTSVAPATTLR